MSLFKENLLLRAVGFFQIPMIFFVGPRLRALDEDRCELVIPLNRRTKNHLKSLYIACFTVGADLAGGVLALKMIRDSGEKLVIVFKDFKADFLKRAEGDTVFTCNEGKTIREMVGEAARTGERVTRTLKVTATVPSKLGDEPVAQMEITLSLKKKSS